ncbi:MAG: DNA polymerase IV [Firmicutes bacterium HGW-Firmicutes-1]|jgi:DNA polymerase-4|nr:MAG: DNA polymerase IV [Firmicutes bacterium HGW-Firmicutes-1]
MSTSPTIFHIDANSAYLSWSAISLLQQGYPSDLRDIPSVVGGNEKSRHGIVLAKSLPAKRFNIQTGESLRAAFAKCPDLISVPPDYSVYMKASKAMVTILQEYTRSLQRFSVDECFLDYTHMSDHFGEPLECAHNIKERIKKELGFTVNIGVSSNKILAKMASDFSKPNKIHTLYSHEIQEKMWPLPVRDLFMVGRRTELKLHQLGIYTIGALAKADTHILFSHFKSHGLLIQQYANGIDDSIVRKSNHELVKGMGNSTTMSFDAEDYETAYKVLLSLVENVCMRLRSAKMSSRLIAISITTNTFGYTSHQRKIDVPTDSTNDVYHVCKQLFNELWQGTPLRKLGVSVSELTDNDYVQMTLFDSNTLEKYKALDKCIDAIRLRYGNNAAGRACFLHSGIQPMTGGIGEDDYPVMTSIL